MGSSHKGNRIWKVMVLFTRNKVSLVHLIAFFSLTLFAFVLLSPSVVTAAANGQSYTFDGAGILKCPTGGNVVGASPVDALQCNFANAASKWMDKVQGYALRLFFLLLSLEMTWTAIRWAIDKQSISDLFASLGFKIISVGFFIFLIEAAGPGLGTVQNPNNPIGISWPVAVIQSFANIGQDLAGGNVTPTSMTPSAVLNNGGNLASSIMREVAFGPGSSPSLLNPVGVFNSMICAAMAIIISFAVLLAYVVIGGQLLITIIEVYVLGSVGIILLGFAGSRWTIDNSTKYVSYIFSVGVKLLVLYVVVGLGNDLTQTYIKLLSDFQNSGANSATVGIPLILQILVGSLLFALMAWMIPAKAASLLNGATNMSLGTAIAGAIATSAIGKGIVQGGGGALLGAGRAGMAGAKGGVGAYAALKNGGGSMIGGGFGTMMKGIASGDAGGAFSGLKQVGAGVQKTGGSAQSDIPMSNAMQGISSGISGLTSGKSPADQASGAFKASQSSSDAASSFMNKASEDFKAAGKSGISEKKRSELNESGSNNSEMESQMKNASNRFKEIGESLSNGGSMKDPSSIFKGPDGKTPASLGESAMEAKASVARAGRVLYPEDRSGGRNGGGGKGDPSLTQALRGNPDGGGGGGVSIRMTHHE